MAFAELSKKFEYKGYPCVVLYHPDIHDGYFAYRPHPYYCGYVGLTKESKYYGTPYDDIPVCCHGDLTYGRFHKQNGEEWSTDEFLDDEYYWIGFDCNHLDDDAWTCNQTYTEKVCMYIVDQLEGEDDKKD